MAPATLHDDEALTASRRGERSAFSATGKEMLLFLVMPMASHQQTHGATLGGLFPTTLDNQNSFVSYRAAFIVLTMGRKVT